MLDSVQYSQGCLVSNLLLKPCHKKQESLNRKGAKDSKLKIIKKIFFENRASVFKKAAFSFAACLVKQT